MMATTASTFELCVARFEQWNDAKAAQAEAAAAFAQDRCNATRFALAQASHALADATGALAAARFAFQEQAQAPADTRGRVR